MEDDRGTETRQVNIGVPNLVHADQEQEHRSGKGIDKKNRGRESDNLGAHRLTSVGKQHVDLSAKGRFPITD